MDSVNASGGIKGRQIKLVVEDDQGDATKSQADIRQLVQVDHVLAIVSPEASGTESGWASYVAAAARRRGRRAGGHPGMVHQPLVLPVRRHGADLAGDAGVRGQGGGQELVRRGVLRRGRRLQAGRCPRCRAYAKAFRLDLSTSAAIAVAAPSYTAQCLAARQAGAQALIIDASYAAGSRFAPACAQQGYSPVYVIPSGAFDNGYLQVSQVNGAYVPTTNALWFAGTPAVDQFKAGDGQVRAGHRAGPEPDVRLVGRRPVRRRRRRACRLIRLPADVFTALYALPKNDTLNGLSPPLNFHSGGPASQVTCFFLGQIENGAADRPPGHRAHLPVRPAPGAPAPGAPGPRP